MKTPDLVVIGAQKAGSTFLADALHASGRVWVQPDEVPYFESPFFERSSPCELARALAKAPPGMPTAIKRPDYLAKPEVPGNLATIPDVRLAAALRDPVDRAVAATAWYVLHGILPVKPLDQLLRQLVDDHAAGRLDGRRGEIIRYGEYGAAVRRYLRHFPLERLVLVGTDELASTDGRRRAVARVLRVPPEAVSAPGPTPRRNEGVYHPLRLRVLRTRVPLVYNWSRPDTYTYRPRRRYRPVRTVIAGLPLAADRYVLSRLVDERPPEIDAGVRHDLATLYEPDVIELENLTGFDTTPWRQRWGR